MLTSYDHFHIQNYRWHVSRYKNHRMPRGTILYFNYRDLRSVSVKNNLFESHRAIKHNMKRPERAPETLFA